MTTKKSHKKYNLNKNSKLKISKVVVNKGGKKNTKNLKNVKNNPYNKFIYLDEKNRIIKDSNTLTRINQLRIPPGYHDVKISTAKNSKIQAVGYDNLGRKQYIYHQTFIDKNRDTKYNNIIKLGENINRIKSQVTKILDEIADKPHNSWSQPISNIAIIVYLLYKCNIRVGNFKYAKRYGSYGATTLCKKHIAIDKNKNKVFIEFIGKKGVSNKCEITSQKMTQIFTKLKNNTEEFLFTYNDGSLVSSDQINNYLKMFNPELTPKMFRTWYANHYFLQKLRLDYQNNDQELIKVMNGKKNNKYLRSCFLCVAEKLHNTANVSKKSYLDYQILELFSSKPKEFISFLQKNKKMDTDKLLITIIKTIRNN